MVWTILSISLIVLLSSFRIGLVVGQPGKFVGEIRKIWFIKANRVAREKMVKGYAVEVELSPIPRCSSVKWFIDEEDRRIHIVARPLLRIGDTSILVNGGVMSFLGVVIGLFVWTWFIKNSDL